MKENKNIVRFQVLSLFTTSNQRINNLIIYKFLINFIYIIFF